MSNSNFDEVQMIIDESSKNLMIMQKLVNHLEDSERISEDNSIEKVQCIQALKENIKIVLSQMDKASICMKNSENSKDKIVGFKETFSMEKMKVLIVDDNDINNYVVSQLLMKFGIDTDVVLSGEEALEKYEANEYDIVFMDYIMPGINGVETVRRIRKMNERGKKQFIIGLTANTIEEFKQGLNEYGVELILFKPVKYEQISVILQKEFKEKIAR